MTKKEITEEHRTIPYEEFRKYLDNADEVATNFNDARDERQEIADKGAEKRDKQVLETLKRILPGYNVTDPSRLTDEIRGTAVNEEHARQRRLAGKILKNDLVNILNSIPEKGLQRISAATPVIIAAEGRNQNALVKYSEVQNIIDFAKHNKEGGSPRTESERRYEILATAEGIAANQTSKLREMGYSIDEDTLRKLSIQAVQRDEIEQDTIREYVPKGIGKLESEAKRDYEKVGVTYEKATKETITKLAESDRANEFRAAMDLIYAGTKAKDKDDFQRRLERSGLAERAGAIPTSRGNLAA